MKTKAIQIKEPNRRVQIELFENPLSNNEKCILIYTKRLLDFKTRDIVETKNVYSIGTALCIWKLLDFMFNHPEVKNKYLLKELTKLFSSKNVKNRKTFKSF